MSSMSRVPPPNTGSGSLSACATRCAGIAVLVEAEIEDFGAGSPRPHRRIGVQADEKISLVVVRERGALVETDGADRRRA